MKNKVSLANAGYALFLLFFALEPLLGKWDAYWYALCGLAVVLGVVLVVGIVCIFRRKVSTDDCMDAIKKHSPACFVFCLLGAALSYVYDEQMFYFWNFMVVLEGSIRGAAIQEGLRNNRYSSVCVLGQLTRKSFSVARVKAV